MTTTIQTQANRVARANGMGRATKIILGEHDRLIDATPSGYRKRSTGEYVKKAYLRKGWSGVYYQHAECVVEVDVSNFPQD